MIAPEAAASVGVGAPGTADVPRELDVPPADRCRTRRSGIASAPPPFRGRLEQPAHARPRPRHLFDPDTGWLRRLERNFSIWLGRHFYPRLPWIERAYDGQLRRGLTVSEADVLLAGLPQAFEGFRILLVTDLHAGPFVSPAALRHSLERLLSLEPDVVLLGGDLTTCHLEEFVSHREAFEVLDAPHGVFGVLGNHDYYTEQAPRLRALIEQAGIRVLHNDSTELVHRGARLSLAGVDDLLRGRPDVARALRGTRPPVVLLSHNPDLFFTAAQHGVALMLSGHTHGGQMRVPGLPVLVRQSRFRLDEGRYRIGTSELVVSRGLGAVGLPWRVACPPEAVLLTLGGA